MRPVTPYWRRLRALRTERGLSQAELFRRAEGVGFDTIRALEQDPDAAGAGQKRSRARYPSAATLEAVSRALDVDPSEFPEYRLAKTRELLDERALEGGLEEAWANYKEFVTGLMLLATQSATELERTMSSAQPSEANTGEVRSLLGARKRQNG